MMKAYRAYIFDFDGTLTDTLIVWLSIFRDCLEHFGITPPDDKTLSQHTHDWKQMLQLGVKEEKLPDFISLAHKLAKERLPKAPLYSGAYEVVERLKNNGKKVGIFSTLDRPIFEPALQYRQFDKIVDTAIAGTDVPHRKPHPAGLLKALDELGVSEGEFQNAVYIGDKDTDIQTAHNAGIDAVLYYPASHQVLYPLSELKKHHPEYIISDWQELQV